MIGRTQDRRRGQGAAIARSASPRSTMSVFQPQATSVVDSHARNSEGRLASGGKGRAARSRRGPCRRPLPYAMMRVTRGFAEHVSRMMRPPSARWAVTVFCAGALGCVLAAPAHAQSSAAAPGTTFRDCPACPEMVVLPKGDFMMGSTDGKYDEKPVHRVTIAKPFAVGKFEVTWDEWDACVGEAACDNGPVMEAGGDNGWGKGRRPVIEVSWSDAGRYVAWLNSKVEGEPYRVLSEAEWEYAARAGTSTQYHWGDTYEPSKANISNVMVPVGQYDPNAFGLHDMHGNVLEWVQDCYLESYEGAPADGSPIPDTADCLRVVRSGSWSYGPRVLRAADRYGLPPTDRNRILGFRVARSLGP